MDNTTRSKAPTTILYPGDKFKLDFKIWRPYKFNVGAKRPIWKVGYVEIRFADMFNEVGHIKQNSLARTDLDLDDEVSLPNILQHSS